MAAPLHIDRPGTTKADVLWAAERNDVALLQRLLDEGAHPDTSGPNGRCGLHLAAYLGHLPAIALLLERHADANVSDMTGSTPLHDAAQAGHTEVAEALLRAGACATTKNLVGITPVEIAYQRNHEATLKVLSAQAASAGLSFAKTLKAEQEETTEWWERQQPKAAELPPEAYNRRRSLVSGVSSEALPQGHGGGTPPSSPSRSRFSSDSAPLSPTPGSPQRQFARALSVGTATSPSTPLPPPSSPGRSRFASDESYQPQLAPPQPRLLQVTEDDMRGRSRSMPSLNTSPLAGRRHSQHAQHAQQYGVHHPQQSPARHLPQPRSSPAMLLTPPRPGGVPGSRSAEDVRHARHPMGPGGGSPTWVVSQHATPPVFRSPMPVRKPSLSEQVERLTALHLSGQMSDTEYAAQRRRLALTTATTDSGGASPVYG
eukprot:m.31005 g.31005  ORF g.31005 m.31005 type:complete len:430 (+) comp9613_c0_seq1:172-1461(+)